MSTNFYLRNRLENRKKDMLYEEIGNSIKKFIPHLYNDMEDRIVSIVEELYKTEIHIAKTSAGWKPVFQSSENFRSVDELKSYYLLNFNTFEIVDEYNRVYNWEDFSDRVLKHCQDGKRNSNTRKDNSSYDWLDFEFC